MEDNTGLKTVDAAVIGTADKDNCAPNVSKFLPLWQQAFQIMNGTFQADTNTDLRLTIQELFDFTMNIPNGGENPFALMFGSNNQFAIVAIISEPSVLILLLSGGIGVGFARGRKRPKLSCAPTA